MEELSIDEVIIFNLLVLIEEVNQRRINTDDIERYKVGIFHGSWWVGAVKVESHSDIEKCPIMLDLM